MLLLMVQPGCKRQRWLETKACCFLRMEGEGVEKKKEAKEEEEVGKHRRVSTVLDMHK